MFSFRVVASCVAGLAAMLGACSTPPPSTAASGGSATGTGDKAQAREALERRLAQLEGEAARLADASQIRRLQRAYGYYVDAADWDQVADLFADDGTIEIGLDGVYAGQARVRAYLHALGHGRVGLQNGQLNEHIQLQPVVDVASDGRSARGRWRAFIMAGEYGHSAVWGEGTYENEYVKDRGVWKIKRLHWYQTFLVPYAGGWLKNRDLNGGVFVSAQLPPDRPPSERYETWPGVYIPPFHYPNPGRASPPAGNPAEAFGPAVTELARRIERLKDTEQIERLVSIYGYYLDKQQWDDLTDLFATDGIMEISQRGIYAGRPSIRRALELFGPQNIEPGHLHNHIQYQPVIHVSPDGTKAFTRSRALSEIGTFERSAIWGDGVYENEYVKENGVWKIAKDHVYTTFFASYEGGWLNPVARSPKVSEKIPPDRPPSEVYESYPEVYIPPYHYAHPVRGVVASPQLTAQQLDALPAAARQLAKDLERLEDERAIENLQRSYGFYVDKALWKETADLFADNGTLEIGGRGVFVGKARVLQYLVWLAPQGLTRGKLFNHTQMQPVVTVAPDGRTARGRWHFLAEVGDYQKSALWGTGTYENEYVKENGVWKIAKLHGFFRMYTPYADGWGKTAVPNTHPERDLPPDRPPTVQYEDYPSTYIPPYHYPNPVTGK